MENINHRPHRRQPKNNSGDDDKFSFPVFPLFEEDHHGCGTHDHPGLSPNSPADHLFFNGRLLPHSFPSYQPTYYNYTYSNFSRSASITSSVSSKDSFMSSSSRSNSTNSRSSSCSSARTSTSTIDQASVLLSDRKYKLFMADQKRPKNPTVLSLMTTTTSSPHYGSSRRWQFIMPAPPPTLKKHHQQQQGNKGGSRTRKFLAVHHHDDENGEREEELKKYKKKHKRLESTGRWFGWGFFRSFVSACKECHAMNPSPRKYLTD